ncbi:MAG: beta-propeller domain-containing protein, partial [Burkholderiales bacterium]
MPKQVSLASFTGPEACDALERYIEDTAVLEMRTQLDAARDGVPSWGWDGGPVRLMRSDGRLVPAAEFDGAGDGGGAAPPPSPTSPPSEFTTTNVQVAGVDEPDVVKNDGTRIFSLAGNLLHAVRSWPPEQMQRAASLEIEGYPIGMFLDGDRIVVLSQIYEWYVLENGADARIECIGPPCGEWNTGSVKITEVDATDMANLRIEREAWLPGSYVAARMVERAVHVVLADNFAYPATLEWWVENDAMLQRDPPARRSAWDTLITENEQRIRARSLREWLPAARVASNGGASELPLECGDFARVVNAPTRLGTLTVATLAADTGSIVRTSIVAEAGEVYASRENLYVATRHWWSWPEIGQEDATYVHKFDISGPDRAPYLASGEVGGHVVDQFSLDEAASGHLRVVTTVERRVADPQDPRNEWGRIETVNRLTVLEQRGETVLVMRRFARAVERGQPAQALEAQARRRDV